MINHYPGTFDHNHTSQGESKLKSFFLVCLVLFHCVLFSMEAGATPIGLSGDTIDVAVIRTIHDSFYGSGRILNNGLDEPFQVVDGNSDKKKYSGAFIIDVDSLSFYIDFLSLNSWQEGTVLRISDLDFIPNETVPFSLDIETNIGGLTWCTGVDYIDIDLFSIRQNADSFIRGELVVAPVPEPATFSMLFAGLAGLLRVSRKKHLSPMK